jgi:hypothetical protein
MPKWTFTPVIDGDDIVVRGTQATRFGGTDDDQDNGIGAWGFPVRSKPSALVVSLPIRANVASLQDSPLPPLKGLTAALTQIVCVRVHSPATGKSVDCLLADIGPSGGLNRGLDMSNAVVKALGLSLEDGIYTVDYRIMGQANALKQMQLSDAK